MKWQIVVEFCLQECSGNSRRGRGAQRGGVVYEQIRVGLATFRAVPALGDVLSICKNRLCAVSVKIDRVSKTEACSLDHSAVFLLHSCPWSLEPIRAVVNIHMLSIHRSRLQAASLDIPPSRTCGVSIHIERSKLGIPNSHIPTQLNSARFLASRHHNVAIDLVL